MEADHLLTNRPGPSIAKKLTESGSPAACPDPPPPMAISQKQARRGPGQPAIG